MLNLGSIARRRQNRCASDYGGFDVYASCSLAYYTNVPRVAKRRFSPETNEFFSQGLKSQTRSFLRRGQFKFGEGNCEPTLL